ncbi:MAG: antitoxin family protein [Polyangiaceae bacterium]
MPRIEACYQDGILKPAKPLSLRPGEVVGVIVTRRPDPRRWILGKLAANPTEDEALATAGLDAWIDDLDTQDGP